MSSTTSPLTGFKYTSYDVSLNGSKSLSIFEIGWYNISDCKVLSVKLV